MIKFGIRDFIFLRFDAKRLNRTIKYLRKLRNLQDMILGTSTCTWYFFVYMYLVFLHSLVQKNQTGLLFMYCKILHVPVLGFSTYTCTWYLYICLVMQHTFWTSTYIWYFICICTSMCIWELYMYFYTSSWFKYFYLSLMWGLTSQYWHKHLIVKVYMLIIYMLINIFSDDFSKLHTLRL